MNKINLKDMVIGFLLGILVMFGIAAMSPAVPAEKFSGMLDMGNHHYYILTTREIYHIKLKEDRIIDTSRVASLKDLKQNLVIRYNR